MYRWWICQVPAAGWNVWCVSPSNHIECFKASIYIRISPEFDEFESWEVISCMHSMLRNSFHSKHRVAPRHGWNIVTITSFLSYVPDTFECEKVEATTVKPYRRKMTMRGKRSGWDVLILIKTVIKRLQMRFHNHRIYIWDKFQKIIAQSQQLAQDNADPRKHSLDNCDCDWNASHHFLLKMSSTIKTAPGKRNARIPKVDSDKPNCFTSLRLTCVANNRTLRRRSERSCMTCRWCTPCLNLMAWPSASANRGAERQLWG